MNEIVFTKSRWGGLTYEGSYVAQLAFQAFE